MRRIVGAFPETSERISHGSPTFWGGKKTFASFHLDHHGDGRVAVVDKEGAPGAHQTSHSSGVVHRGVYYTPGSLKAQLCVEGAAALLAYCDEREIPVLRCGKVVVATTADELPRLEELHRRSLANGVPRVELIGPERLRELEPHVAGVRALHSPETAVVDFTRVAAAYADDVRAASGELLLGREVIALTRRDGTAVVETTAGEVEAARGGGARDPQARVEVRVGLDAAAVVLDDVAEGGEPAVVHVRAGHRGVAQRRRLEAADVARRDAKPHGQQAERAPRRLPRRAPA